MDFWILFFAIAGAGVAASVEVHFETPDSGFFLKHSPRQNTVADTTVSQGGRGLTKAQDSVLSVDKFTIVQTTQPVSIRATYGPFSTKQTVPARYIVPDVVESQSDHAQNATAALLDLQQSNLHLDISAHLVRQTIPRDSPVLRVLFHAGADPGGHLQRQKICVLLHVSLGSHIPLKGRCMPEGEDGVCVAEVIIPSNWWPPLPPPEKDGRSTIPPKVPQRLVQVSYSVFEPPAKNPEQCEPKVQIQPLTSFAQIPLIQAQSPYKELRADETLTMLVPHAQLYPMSRIHVPVFLQSQPGQNVAVFIVRARVKAGMKILGATASSADWNISVEKENAKHTVARVTAFRKDQDPDSTGKENDDSNSNKITEVFSWLLEIGNDTKDHWDGGRIVWSVSYVHDGPKLKDSSVESTGGPPEESRRRLIAKLEIQKDDIQAVLPISKNWELMNTAVLTGRQVSQAMKVFIVSQSGRVSDVTLQSSCQAEDESVIKVSSSCSSVYVDGSEGRGSSNASVVVKYGSYSGRAKFIVWMPEFPLEVSVSDFRLSQIKGWKIPDEHNAQGKMNRRKRAYSWNHHTDDYGKNFIGSDRSVCRARYQQSPVEVYARFLAVDQDSGRVSYLISRRTGLRVTDLVQPLLRVADPKIATLRGRTLQGRAMGRTDVQVLSPITGRVIGSKEIRVGSDKVNITRLVVRVVSGLQLNITSDSTIENGYIAETTVTRRLTAQYQEGLLDIDLEFSDGARTPLREISVDDYFLLVESLDTEVVAFAPMLASHHPRVIAVGEGNGDLLRVTLLLSEECRLRRNVPLPKQGPKLAPGPLASALASVQVDFSTTENPNRPDTVQNDGILGRERKGGRDLYDLADILIGIPLKDDSNHEPTVQARQHRGGLTPLNVNHKDYSNNLDMSSFEIGMYVLLTAFCFAIVVFVISCVVYASKFRPLPIEVAADGNGNKDGAYSSAFGILREPKRMRESTTNAHDWVWLGRSTMDRSIGQDANGNVLDNQRDSRIRITNNPMNVNYSDPDDAIVQATSFDNPNHIQLPSLSESGYPIDTSTYTKKDHRRSKLGDEDVPPPLPPHAVPLTEQNNNEYRPPVPPHRNIGVTANVNPNNNNNNNNNVNICNISNNNGNSNRSIPESIVQPQKRHHHHSKHHQRTSSNGQLNRRSIGMPDPPVSVSAQIQPQQHVPSQPTSQASQVSTNLHNLNLTQQQINAALFNVNAPNPGYSPRLVNQVPPIRNPKPPPLAYVSPTQNIHNNLHHNIDNHNTELHMAEKLVESAAQQQKNAFQFDTDTPKRGTKYINPNQRDALGATDDKDDRSSISNSMLDSGIGLGEVQLRNKNKHAANKQPSNHFTTNTSDSSSNSDDNGGFITPPGVGDNKNPTNNKQLQVKRATVVENPMFSTSSPGSDLAETSETTPTTNGPNESLGLDDLDMDYEQIMHYFDNLKESNA